MSEFQYFEFQAIERDLTKDEQATLRAFSTRAEIGRRRFANTYHWGDFKGNTIGWMKKYFDAHVYLSNFGSRALHLRLPLGLLDRETTRPYEVKHVFEVHQTPTHLVLSIYSNEESGCDVDEHDDDPGQVLDALLPLRNDLARGDVRSLYVMWLRAVKTGFVGADVEEPPVPPGLGEPSAALESLMSFLWLEPELIEVAARRSPPACPPRESKVTAEAWLATLSAEEKTSWLVRLLTDPEGNIALELHRDFQHAARRDVRASREADPAFDFPRRRAGELMKTAEDLAELKLKIQKQKQEAARALREKEAARERVIYLRTLAGQETNLWNSAIALTATSAPANYDTAVRQLIDLRDLSDLAGDRDKFSQRLKELRNLRSRKPSLIARLDKAGLH